MCYPGGLNVIVRVLKRERGRSQSQRRGCEDRGWSDTTVAWKGATGHRMRASPRSWKR